MWHLVFAYVSIKRWVIDSDQDWYFDGSSNIRLLSAHNAEIFNGEVMNSDVVVVMDG